MTVKLIDCTLRDGGYYNNWDFSQDLISAYLPAMAAASVDVVELGFRSFDTKGFRGAYAYTTDKFIKGLSIPSELGVGVMVNAAELLSHPLGSIEAVRKLFCHSSESPVDLVRVACHVHEVEPVIPACTWLASSGYQVGLNLMQVGERSDAEIEHIAGIVNDSAVDVLYFADSLGSLDPDQTARIIRALRLCWKGPLGIHTHDNMGCAVANTLRAIEEGVSWVDSTVTGMGRGPGNAQTEYIVVELEKLAGKSVTLTPLLALIRRYFSPLQSRYGWGKNPFYYLSGLYGIHPTFIQEMLNDSRYEEADILSVIEHLRKEGAKKFSENILEAGRQMYGGEPMGTWAPSESISAKDVLIVGAGPGAVVHREAIQQFIREQQPFVIALNTQNVVDADLIDMRAACHPFRLLADCESYRSLPHPLIVPVARLNKIVRDSLRSVALFDFGLTVEQGIFRFGETSAVVPSSLVIAYALAVSTSGNAARILMAGFDGYESDDPRTLEMDELLSLYQAASGARPLLSITPTKYRIPSTSVYAL